MQVASTLQNSREKKQGDTPADEMKPGAEYAMVHGPAASASAPRSPWQSPVLYLFSGLAVMLGLIALSLLALACSYWKFSAGSPDNDRASVESRADRDKGSAATGAAVEWQFHVVVIMAGDERPTFLATPESRRAADGAQPADDVAASWAGGTEEAKSSRPAGSVDDPRSRISEQPTA